MPVQEQKMERTSISLTGRQSDSLDEMVRQGIYPSAAEAIRAGVGLLEDKHGIHGKSNAMRSPRREGAAAS